MIHKIKTILKKWVRGIACSGSQKYWELNYARGGRSGSGSYGRLAEFKAEVINSFVTKNNIASVIEFGCGDGNQLSLAHYPSYIGFDVSKTAVKICEKRFRADKTKKFILINPNHFPVEYSGFKADLCLSLDVIYHLTEDKIYLDYMKQLFLSSRKFVIIYSTDFDSPCNARGCIKNRHFTEYIRSYMPEWELIETIKNRYPDESGADFYIYKIGRSDRNKD
jgi:hypothetical protein